jgi:hypothetical protein
MPCSTVAAAGVDCGRGGAADAGANAAPAMRNEASTSFFSMSWTFPSGVCPGVPGRHAHPNTACLNASAMHASSAVQGAANFCAHSFALAQKKGAGAMHRLLTKLRSDVSSSRCARRSDNSVRCASHTATRTSGACSGSCRSKHRRRRTARHRIRSDDAYAGGRAGGDGSDVHRSAGGGDRQNDGADGRDGIPCGDVPGGLDRPCFPCRVVASATSARPKPA